MVPRRCDQCHMSWIESHQSLLNHRKTNRAVILLKCNRYEFIGHMQALWWWALDNAPTGDLVDLLPEEIAEAGGWPAKKGQQVVDVLCQVGFLDSNAGRYQLHDWMQYAGRYLRLTQQRAEAGRKGGLARAENASKQNDGLLQANASDRVAPSFLPSSPSSPSDHPTTPSVLPNARAVLQLSPIEVGKVRALFPNADINARFLEWVNWIEEEGKKGRNRMPDKKLEAFIGWLKKNDGSEEPALVPIGGYMGYGRSREG